MRPRSEEVRGESVAHVRNLGSYRALLEFERAAGGLERGSHPAALGFLLVPWLLTHSRARSQSVPAQSVEERLESPVLAVAASWRHQASSRRICRCRRPQACQQRASAASVRPGRQPRKRRGCGRRCWQASRRWPRFEVRVQMIAEKAQVVGPPRPPALGQVSRDRASTSSSVDMWPGAPTADLAAAAGLQVGAT